MLFIRRKPGEKIVLFTADHIVFITVTELGDDYAVLQFSNGMDDEGTFEREFTIGQRDNIFAGRAELLLRDVVLTHSGRDYAYIGIQAPQDIQIRRSENVSGLTPAEIMDIRS